MMGFYGFIRGGEAWPRSKAAANQAIRWDPTNAEAHVALSLIALQADHNLELGIAEGKKAVELAPDLAIAHHGLAIALNCACRSEEALVSMRKAVELEPLTSLFQGHVGWTLHNLGRDDEAWDYLQATIKVHPNDYYVFRIMMYCANSPERCQVVIEEAKRVAALSGSATFEHVMSGVLYAKMGDRERAQKIAAELESQSASIPTLIYPLALIRCALGELEASVDWLEKAEHAESGILIILACEPSWSPLRPLPRFQALLRKLGLPVR
jgi:serine/threonine-protein kinase